VELIVDEVLDLGKCYVIQTRSALLTLTELSLFPDFLPGNGIKGLFVYFVTAMFTLRQITTGDDWSVIVRNMFESTGMSAVVPVSFGGCQLIMQ
jgi:hypothetical protein